MPGLQVAHRTVYSVHWQPLVTSGHHSKVPGTLAWPGLAWPGLVTQPRSPLTSTRDTSHYRLPPTYHHLAPSTWLPAPGTCLPVPGSQHLAPSLPAPSYQLLAGGAWCGCVQVTGSWLLDCRCCWWPGGVTRDCEWILTLAGGRCGQALGGGQAQGQICSIHFLYFILELLSGMGWRQLAVFLLVSVTCCCSAACCSLAPLGQLMDSREECPDHCAAHCHPQHPDSCLATLQ